MNLITPADGFLKNKSKKMLFLAGPILGAEDWQSKVIHDLQDLDIVIASPRQEKTTEFNLNTQIEWESYHLQMADVIMFWIPLKTVDISGRDYAQTSRFELGEWLAKTNYGLSHKKVILGIENGFFGRTYIAKRLEKTPIHIFETYEQTLAETKKTLSRTSQIFFTADTHFGSERTLTLTRRPFTNFREMDETLIVNWNKLIGKNDIVYHLGDFGTLDTTQKLNGKIHLIMGNYEEALIDEDPEYFDALQKVFVSVQKNATITLKDGSSVFLTHKPSHCRRDMFSLFGHIHGHRVINYFGIDVGVDAHYFYPISEDDILFYKNSILHYYDYENFL